MGIIKYYLFRWDYFKHPEGQDIVGKLLGAGKWAIFASYLGTSWDAVGVTRCMTFAEVLNCAAFYFIPICGATTAFVTTTYALTNLRGKDDPLNYMAATLPAIGILHHSWWKKFPAGFTASILFWSVLSTGIIKSSYDSGTVYVPKVYHTDTYHMWVPNLSYVENRPRGSWTKYYD